MTSYAHPETGPLGGLDMDSFFDAPLEQKKKVLGETMWPFVSINYPRSAAKIRELMLEKDIDTLVSLTFDETAFVAEIEKISDLIEPRDDNHNVDKMEDVETGNDEPETQYDNDPEVLNDSNNRVCCVYISNLFTDQNNFVYYIRGTQNLNMFYLGSTGMQAFDGAVLFTISPHPLPYLMRPINLGSGRYKRLPKNNIPLESIKWRYTYDTARLAWDKSDVDLSKLQELMENRSISPVRDNPSIGSQRPFGPLGPLEKAFETHPGTAEIGAKLQPVHFVPGNLLEKDELDRNLPRTTRQGKKHLRVRWALDDQLEDHRMDRHALRSDSVIEGMRDVHFGGQSEQEYLNLIMHLKNKSQTLGQLWITLKDYMRQRPVDTESELADKIIAIMRREEEISKAKSVAAIRGDKVTDDLKQLEGSVLADRNRALQEFSNTWAEKWHSIFSIALTEELSRRQDKTTSRSQIKRWLMDVLMHSMDGPNQSTAGPLDTQDIQAVINLADNFELERECMDKMQGANNDSEESDRLDTMMDSFEEDRVKYISDLSLRMFNRFGHMDVRKLMLLSTQPTETWEPTDPPKDLTANEAVIYDRNTTIDTDTSNVSNPALSAKQLGKRPVLFETPAEGSKAKKDKEKQEGEDEPEETLEEARARLERIITEANRTDEMME
ncbi:hypothetical protein E8E13_006822 [Curvularia kusanoi]|uniref:PABC domain-containing protein n=1 Tax=Curvularia kusanoi TaxID=90978 RepID=A0A9P4WAD7_CURKU|nr:hypothetical protein E8E13_006822 [Curvularia kusanoi]